MSSMLELDVLRQLSDQLATAAHRERGALVGRVANQLGLSSQTVYNRLKQNGLYDSGRRRRADAGKTIVDEELALKAAGMLHLATRANGKRTMSVRAATELLASNGMGVVNGESGEIAAPSPKTLARAMRKFSCHPDQLAAGHPAVSMRSLHPNHVWEVDMSVCVLFYAPTGGITRIDDAEVYKNKPDAIEKVSKDLCLRWLITDHCTDTQFIRYAAGHEDAMSFIEFFIEAIQERPGEPFFGVPKILVMDPGAAARAATARNLLKRLGVEVIVHKPRNPRAKGQVEGGHNRWEFTFESRLSLWLPESVAALNTQADLVRRAWCATAIHTRHKMTRFEAWLRITGEQLRRAPSAEICRGLVTGREETRVVADNLTISFSVPGFGANTYSVRHIPSAAIRERLRVVVNPYRAPAIDVLTENGDGTDTAWTCEPIGRDDFGFLDIANTWGAEIRGAPKSAAEKQLDRIHKEAFGVPTQAEATAARKARATAYDGVIDAFADARAAQIPTYMPRRALPSEVVAQNRELPPVAIVEAIRRLRTAGDARGELYAELATEFPDGCIPGAELARREAVLQRVAHQATGT